MNSKVLSILALVMCLVVRAEIPNSCYWCVSTGSTWNTKNNTCAKTGFAITKVKQCTGILEFKGLDMIYLATYDGKLKNFTGSAI